MNIVQAQRAYRRGIPTFQTTIGVDTEYYSVDNKPSQPITVQLAPDSHTCTVLEHPSYGGGHLPTFVDCALIEGLGLTPADPESDVEQYLIVQTLVFFSPKDLLFLFARTSDQRKLSRSLDQTTRLMLKRQKTRVPTPYDTGYSGLLDGKVTRILLEVKDLSRIGQGGLAKTASSLGLTMGSKDLMEQYKTDMRVPYEDATLRPLFIEYAQNDATILHDVIKQRSTQVEELFSVHGFTPPREYLSNGSLVSDLFVKYIAHLAGDSKPWKRFTTDGSPLSLKDLLALSSVEHYVTMGKRTHERTLSLVLGGRAKNENPAAIKRELLADSDGSGAYVSQMMSMVYPVGVPSTWSKDLSQKGVAMTYGEMRRKLSAELVPGCWHAVVQGSLTFPQTLLHSKVVNRWALDEKTGGADDKMDEPNIKGDFCLLTQEVVNGVMTEDTHDMLRRAASNSEWGEIENLEVLAVCWYPASKRCTTFEEMDTKVVADGGHVEVSLSAQGRTSQVDNRAKYWVGVSLRDFLKPYADKRKAYKDQRNSHPKGSAEWKMYDAKQGAMKLVGNTFYGTTASPLLPTCNTTVSNNITAALRCWVWGLAMSCGAVQSITDGGAHSLNHARFHGTSTKSAMSLRNLSYVWIVESEHLLCQLTTSMNTTLSRRVCEAFTTGPLGGRGTWQGEPGKKEGTTRVWNEELGIDIEREAEKWGELDALVHQHMKAFWAYREPTPPDVIDRISVAIKDVYQLAVFQGQTDYLFIKYNGEETLKARGHMSGLRYNGHTERTNKYEVFQDLLHGPKTVKALAPQSYTRLLKVNQHRRMAASSKSNVVQTEDLLPGDAISQTITHRHISMAPFFYRTSAERKAWHELQDSWKKTTGFGLEGAFANQDGTLDYAEALHTLALHTMVGAPPSRRGNSRYNANKGFKHPHYQG